jgi:hypothetical protein
MIFANHGEGCDGVLPQNDHYPLIRLDAPDQLNETGAQSRFTDGCLAAVHIGYALSVSAVSR